MGGEARRHPAVVAATESNDQAGGLLRIDYKFVRKESADR